MGDTKETNQSLFRMCEALRKQSESQADIIRRQSAQIDDMMSTLHAMRDTMQDGIVEALITACEFKTYENAEHMRRLGYVTRIILSETPFGDGLADEQIRLISLAATLHDIGKVAIPNHILEFPGELSAGDYEVVKLHTVKGAELLHDIEQLRDLPIYEYAVDIARHHHERWDGNGYPDHLVGDETSVWSQAVAIADVYDALRSERCYHSAFDRETTMSMIESGKCGAFNPVLVSDFKTIEGRVSRIYDNTMDIDMRDMLLTRTGGASRLPAFDI